MSALCVDWPAEIWVGLYRVEPSLRNRHCSRQLSGRSLSNPWTNLLARSHLFWILTQILVRLLVSTCQYNDKFMLNYHLPTIPKRPTWLEINRRALAHNIQLIRKRIGARRLCAVVKANAYGHGATTIAAELLAAGADQLAVAALSEASELRAAGIRAPILILGYTPPWLAHEAVDLGVTTTVYDLEVPQALAAAARSAKTRALVHVKVNTGMNRLGIAPGQALAFIAQLTGERNLAVEGIFTHFATSDLADKHFAYVQLASFVRLLNTLAVAGCRPPCAHAANSAAMLTMPAAYFEMVRCGIAVYGLHPDAEQTPLPPDFQPVLTWKAQIAHVLDLQVGASVGYGQEFVAREPMKIAVIPVGYGDGFPRRPFHWGRVLIHGQTAPIIGRVCMDQTIVDVSQVALPPGGVRPGDEVVLIGRQGAAELSAETVAAQLHTNNYDVVCRILSRVPRLLVND